MDVKRAVPSLELRSVVRRDMRGPGVSRTDLAGPCGTSSDAPVGGFSSAAALKAIVPCANAHSKPFQWVTNPHEIIAAVRHRHEALFATTERKAAMKNKYKIGAAMIGSFVFGVGASSILHAQAKPPAFVWAEVDIKDRLGFFGNFTERAQANIKGSGGKFLADTIHRDSPNVIGLNGPPPPDVTLLQFADMEAAKAFFAKMGPLQADVGNKYANFHVVAIEGL
jgi:uncharacterized protein (DUF1330 family)